MKRILIPLMAIMLITGAAMSATYPTLSTYQKNWLNDQFKNVYKTFGDDYNNLLEGDFDDITVDDSEGDVSILNGYIQIDELSAPSGNPASNKGWIYAKDATGTTKLYFEDSSGTVTDLLAAGSTAWDDVGDPDGNTAIDMTDYYTAIDFGDTDHDMFELDFTGAFGDYSCFLLSQNTGNPTNGTLMELKLTDADVDFLSCYRSAELFKVDSSGNITAAGTLDLTGLATFAAGIDVTGSAGVILENDAAITNSTNSEITFTEAGEDITLDMDSSSNVIGLKSSTGVTGLALGTVDDLSGVGSIAFDAAAASISTATTGAAQDLTVEVTGAQNSSLIMASSGTGADAYQVNTTAGGQVYTITGAAANEDFAVNTDSSITLTASEADNAAIRLNASAGGMDLDAAGKIAIDLAGAGIDFDVDSTAGSIYLDGGEADAKAIWLAATDAAGGVTVDFGTGNLDITGTGASADVLIDGDVISLDGTGPSNLTVTADADADDLTLAVLGNHNASVLINSEGSGTDAVKITTSTNGGDILIQSADDLGIGNNAVAQDITIGNETGASSLALKAGTGNIDIQGVAASTITIGDAAQTGAITIGASTATMTDLSLGTGVGAHSIHIGDGGTAAQVVALGSDSDASSVTIKAGTGDVAITSVDDLTLNGGSVGSLINIGTNVDGNVVHFCDNNTAADSITMGSALDTVSIAGISMTVGSTGTTSATTIQSGTGDLALTSTDDITLTTNTAITDAIKLTCTQGTGTDAISLQATAGGIDVDGGAGADISVKSTGKSVQVESTEGVVDAIKLNASNGGGGIDIDAGTGGITMDITGAGDLRIDSSAGSIYVEGAEAAADAISLQASDAAGGITINTGTAGVTFSDDPISNVGDIACDDIVADADSTLYAIPYRTVIKTIQVDDDTITADFACDDDAVNVTEQPIDLGEIIPAYAEIVSCQVRCYETLISSEADPDELTSLDVGVTSGAGDILAAGTPDTANDIMAPAIAGHPVTAATNAARHVWVNIVPVDNWSTLSAGRWAVMITYLDYAAVYAQKGL